MCWQWAGPKLHSLLSIHRLIGAYFLTTKSDKHIRLLTPLQYAAPLLIVYQLYDIHPPPTRKHVQIEVYRIGRRGEQTEPLAPYLYCNFMASKV